MTPLEIAEKFSSDETHYTKSIGRRISDLGSPNKNSIRDQNSLLNFDFLEESIPVENTPKWQNLMDRPPRIIDFEGVFLQHKGEANFVLILVSDRSLQSYF